MSNSHSLIVIILVLCVFSSDGGLYGHLKIRCQTSSPDGHDAVYLEQFYFNKLLELQYNGTLGKIVGYTQEAKEVADTLNKNPSFIEDQKFKTNFCKNRIALTYETLLTPVKPYVWLRSAEAVNSKHSHMLICSMYGFYPKQTKVTWLRDGKEIKSGVTSTEELPSGNWLHQRHSYLEITPKPAEKITCMVEHASLMRPMLYDWEPEPDPGKTKIVVGSAALLLGVLMSLTGLIYNKKKMIERMAVPTIEVSRPDDGL